MKGIENEVQNTELDRILLILQNGHRHFIYH